MEEGGVTFSAACGHALRPRLGRQAVSASSGSVTAGLLGVVDRAFAAEFYLQVL